MAARRPAPPAPITTTSYSWISMFSLMSDHPTIRRSEIHPAETAMM
jgi:hypothetical protein